MTHDIFSLVKTELQSITGAAVTVVRPPQPDLGDLAIPCFELAKTRQQPPAQVATDLAEQITKHLSGISVIDRVVAAGPYLNVFVKSAALARAALALSFSPQPPRGATALVEFFNPNPLKVMHIGHVRNAVTGESIRRLLQFCGFNTIGCSYSGDVGVHVAKWLWYFQNFTDKTIPSETENFLQWAGDLYVAACAKVAEQPEFEDQVNEYNRLIDARDNKVLADWQTVTDKSYAALATTATELDCQIKRSFRESETEVMGKEYVQELIQSGAAHQDQGAWVVDLSEQKLGVFIVLKSDSTALYATKDLGLLNCKHQAFGAVDKNIVVVGSEQEHYFRQLIAAAIQFHTPLAEQTAAVHHGMVDLPSGKMSSRTGNVQSYAELRDAAVDKVKTKMAQENPALVNVNTTARAVALGALKFFLLHVDRSKRTTFNWETALSFTGSSGPYLQYTYARIRAIERKAAAELSGGTVAPELLTDSAERKLLLQLVGFSTSVTRAAEEYQPYLVANYLLDLAGDLNHFYHVCRVVDSADLNRSRTRLALIGQVAEVLKQGLWLLGITAVEEM